jgi:SAM-dependent methyltransferase
MLLSPLTWGNTRDLVDQNNDHSESKNKTQRTLEICKDKPTFITVLNKLKATNSITPDYFVNPIENCSSLLYLYTHNHFTWESFPFGVDIRTHIPETRIERKREQLNNIMAFIVPFLRPGVKVVDFCCGGGHQSIPLAWLFPQCHFVLVDMKKTSLDVARYRIASLNLNNITIFHGKIDEYTEQFDVGYALHACGDASDQVQQACIRVNAAYIIMPCCIGKTANSILKYPRSAFLSKLISKREYEYIAKAADYGHEGYDDTSSNSSCSRSNNSTTNQVADIHFDDETKILNIQRRYAKSILERDRNINAEENSYVTWMTMCYPVTCTPKNDILIGVPNNKIHEINEFKLWCSV